MWLCQKEKAPSDPTNLSDTGGIGACVSTKRAPSSSVHAAPSKTEMPWWTGVLSLPDSHAGAQLAILTSIYK
jgi:hypothetical protein